MVVDGKRKDVDEVVGEGDGDLDREMERMRSAGVGTRRSPSESVENVRVPLVTALRGRAAARASASEGCDAPSGAFGSGVSSGVSVEGFRRSDMGMRMYGSD